MPKLITAHKCNYCDATYLDEAIAIEQELACSFNPQFSFCGNCIYMKMIRATKSSSDNYVQTCQNPFPTDVEFEAPHPHGWCPNYSRNPEFINPK
jgi:hypothetical protein